jgi:hypothetical protein
MAAICAFETFEVMSRVDVNLPLQIPTLDASIGRIAPLRRRRQEGAEPERKQSFARNYLAISCRRRTHVASSYAHGRCGLALTGATRSANDIEPRKESDGERD